MSKLNTIILCLFLAQLPMLLLGQSEKNIGYSSIEKDFFLFPKDTISIIENDDWPECVNIIGLKAIIDETGNINVNWDELNEDLIEYQIKIDDDLSKSITHNKRLKVNHFQYSRKQKSSIQKISVRSICYDLENDLEFFGKWSQVEIQSASVISDNCDQTSLFFGQSSDGFIQNTLVNPATHIRGELCFDSPEEEEINIEGLVTYPTQKCYRFNQTQGVERNYLLKSNRGIDLKSRDQSADSLCPAKRFVYDDDDNDGCSDLYTSFQEAECGQTLTMIYIGSNSLTDVTITTSNGNTFNPPIESADGSASIVTICLEDCISITINLSFGQGGCSTTLSTPCDEEPCDLDPDDGCPLTTDYLIDCVIFNDPPNVDDGCPLTVDYFDAANCTIVHQEPNVDDGCDLTTDIFNAENCVIVHRPPVVDDGCSITSDSFDEVNCTIINAPIGLDDGCDLTADLFDAVNCQIIHIGPVPDDGCPLTVDSFDADNCLIVYEEPNVDDGCPLTEDSFDPFNCQIVNEAPDPDDGCPLTSDSFDVNNCVIINEEPDVDDGCNLTVDSFDSVSCQIINEGPDPDDGCPLTTDSFDAASCTIINEAPNVNDGCNLTIDSFDAINCQIINQGPDPDDGCPLTTDSFDVSSCTIINEEPNVDDSCNLTVDSFDAASCQIINEAPDPDDGCSLTTDSFDANSCTIINEEPNVDDGCNLTVDSFDLASCQIINEAPDPDDGCPLTSDSFDASSCSIINEEPNVDDNCILTLDSFDAASCQIINEAPDPDDGCSLTTDSFDANSCTIINQGPDPDDGCPLTSDSFDASSCSVINEEPNVDDNCNLTLDSFDAVSCQIINEAPDPDDGCSLTTDSFDASSCTIINEEPNVDDGCNLTIDSFDGASCQIINEAPDPDDGCDLTNDSFDVASCSIINEEPNVDDGCNLTTDSFDVLSCQIINEAPDPDDGCPLTSDSFDVNTCMINNIPQGLNDGCELTVDSFDPNSCQIFHEAPSCDDGCDLTVDNFNFDSCACENLAPEVDDNCDLTNDYFNFEDCSIVNETPDIDDGCELTIDSFDPIGCVISHLEPSCDDGCQYTDDSFNIESCSCINAEPNPDDNCEFTIDSFDIETCEFINEPMPCDDGDPCTTGEMYQLYTCECGGGISDDQDNDGLCDSEDNCPTIPNPDQLDCDADGIGDVCDDQINYDLLCQLFNLLNGVNINNGNYLVGFWGEDEDYLEESIDEQEIDLAAINKLLASVDEVGFDLNIYLQGNLIESFPQEITIQTPVSVESLEALSIPLNVTSSTYDQVAFQIFIDSNSGDLECEEFILITTVEEDEEFPGLECGSPLTEEDIVDFTSNENLQSGDIIFIKSFPLLITSLSSTSPYNGTGIIPIPFQNKRVTVDLVNIEVNQDNFVFGGHVTATSGNSITDIPALSLPSIQIDEELCLDPPPPPGYNAEGVNPLTGLDGYGFDTNGNHHLTGGPYDPDGFDSEGNHNETEGPYDEDGCDRDNLDENGVECPIVVVPEGEMTEFIDSLSTGGVVTGTVDSLLLDLYAYVNDQIKIKGDLCESLRTNLKGIAPSPQSHFFGENDELLNEGMSDLFTSEPKPLNTTPKDVIVEQIETTQIQLYHCDDSLQYYKALKAALDEVDEQAITDYIYAELENLSPEEFEYLQESDALLSWIEVKMSEYLVDNHDLPGFTSIDIPVNQNKGIDYYNSVASIDEDFSIYESSELDQIKFEYLNGFKEIRGIPRPIITEAIYKAKLAMGSIDGESGSLLPLAIENNVGQYNYTIYIDNLSITAEGGASLDAAIVITDPNTGKKIAFAAENIGFNTGGITGDSRLYLLSDSSLKVNNTSKIILLGTQQKTFIDWDCNGFKGGSLQGRVEFCPEYIQPLDANLNPLTDGQPYTFEVLTTFQEWLHFTFTLNEADPFVLTTMPSYKWRVGKITLDYSELVAVDIEEVPTGYGHELYDGEALNPFWKGFVLDDLNVTFPNSFKSGNDNPIEAAGIRNLIFDNYGASGEVYVETELVSYEEGDLDGWAFSLSELHLLILNNQLAGGGFGGKIGIPVLKNPLNYTATIAKENNYRFKITTTDENPMDVFLATAYLDKSSYVKAEYTNDTFTAVASLTGTLAIKTDSTILDKVNLPTLKFEGFKVSNKPDYLEAGKWGISGIQGAGISWDGFAIGIDKVYPVSNGSNEEVTLGIDATVAIGDSLLVAKGGFNINGHLTEDDNGRQKWTGLNLSLRHFCVNASIGEVMTVAGCVQYFDEDTPNDTGYDYGKGWRGGLSVQLTKLDNIGATALGQFGKVGEHKYFFVDVLANVGNALTFGPIKFHALGGGLSRGMYPDNGTVSLGTTIDVGNLINYPLGTTLSGVQYHPDPSIGYEFKLMTQFSLAVNDGMLNGVAELAARMQSGGGLEEIEFRGSVQMLEEINFSKFVDVEIPEFMDKIVENAGSFQEGAGEGFSVDAKLGGYISLKMNFSEKRFTGNMAAYLDAEFIKGSGPKNEMAWAEINIGPGDWWIYMGTPSVPCGIKLDGLPIEGEIGAYFDVGTKIPPFPGLPDNVKHLSGQMNINEALRNSGSGIMFGASLELSAEIDAKIAQAQIYAGAGFDLSLRKYEGVACNGEQIGINGWYAMGQMWAYITGKLQFLGVNIFEAGIAAVLQTQLPNPTWIRAALQVKYEASFASGSADMISKSENNVISNTTNLVVN